MTSLILLIGVVFLGVIMVVSTKAYKLWAQTYCDIEIPRGEIVQEEIDYSKLAAQIKEQNEPRFDEQPTDKMQPVNVSDMERIVQLVMKTQQEGGAK